MTWFILTNYVKAIMNLSEDCLFINHRVRNVLIRNVLTALLTDGSENVSDEQIGTVDILLAHKFFI